MKTESQEKQILEALQKGQSLTQIQALNRFNCLRLSSRIHRLKSRGHDIKTQMIPTYSGKFIARYYIENV